MTEHESRALAQIGSTVDPEKLRQFACNARGKSLIVEQAALRRLASVSAKHSPGTIEHDCWAMVHAVEELRRIKGRRVSRMNRMRPKIERDGEVAALEYCAIHETDGFAEVMEYGMPELTAEAIVLRHGSKFSEKAKIAAKLRLENAGVQVDEKGNLALN